jgi:hypothetical protein
VKDYMITFIYKGCLSNRPQRLQEFWSHWINVVWQSKKDCV